MGENQSFQSQRLSDRIPYCLDTEVSPPHPEFWRCGVFEQSFPEADETDARMRDHGAEHPD